MLTFLLTPWLSATLIHFKFECSLESIRTQLKITSILMKFSSPVTIYLSVSVRVRVLVCVCAQPFSMDTQISTEWTQTPRESALRCWLLWHLFIIQFKTRLFAASKGLVLMRLLLLLLRLAGWQLWLTTRFWKTLAFFTTRARFLTPTRSSEPRERACP